MLDKIRKTWLFGQQRTVITDRVEMNNVSYMIAPDHFLRGFLSNSMSWGGGQVWAEYRISLSSEWRAFGVQRAQGISRSQNTDLKRRVLHRELQRSTQGPVSVLTNGIVQYFEKEVGAVLRAHIVPVFASHFSRFSDVTKAAQKRALE